MSVRNASAVWAGSLKEGKGTMKLGSGAWEGPFSFSTRFEETPGTNPEELIGAALAGCFSMALSAGLGRAGYTATRIATSAKVHLEKGEGGFGVTRIDLTTDATVPGIDQATFQQNVEATKVGCPISKALEAVDITVAATLHS
jgi:osmotically inducible protein OsmC